MCLYPLRIRNPGYESLVDCQHRSPFSDSTGDVVPPDYEVDVPCGKCWQCLRQKRFETVLRLKVEQSVIPPGTRSYFVTLTFNQECYVKYAFDYGLCVRRWLDKLRKRYGRFRYWFISELGEKTHRLHFHGILFGMPDIPYKDLCSTWTYGISWYGYCTDRTCGYITKYMIKQQIDEGQVYKPIKIYSKSIGSGRDNSGIDYLSKCVGFRDSHCPGDYPDCITLPGSPYTYAIPRYYFSKLFGEAALIYRRYVNYAKGLRYVFRGVRYLFREQWYSAIKRFRERYSSFYRERFARKLDLILRPPRLTREVRYKYLITRFNNNITDYGIEYNPASVS